MAVSLFLRVYFRPMWRKASSCAMALIVRSIILLCSLAVVASAGNFHDDVDITWGDGRGKVLDCGRLLTLSLDEWCGSGFQSKHEYLFGRIDMQMKLVAGNSAGTVTTYYLSSQGSAHDEIDFEFLGNSSGNPYTLHTNVFAHGIGNREMQFKLWFDPTEDFHTYSIIWNPRHVIDFKNMESRGVQFPNNQPMRVYTSLWNADDWATQGGRVKTDWSKAPFVASYRDFEADACVTSKASRCAYDSDPTESEWWNQELDSASEKRMRYNYCADVGRFPRGLRTECLFG